MYTLKNRNTKQEYNMTISSNTLDSYRFSKEKFNFVAKSKNEKWKKKKRELLKL